jgi:hypothetical protein
MATPGTLVRTMADALGIHAATVAQYDRRLAEAGLRTVAGRGTSAAKVSAFDAANLLIAILGTPASGPSIKAAQQTCERVGSLSLRVDADFIEIRRRIKAFGLPSFADLPPQHTFRCAIATLIRGASLGELFRIADVNNVLTEGDFCFHIVVQSQHPLAEIWFSSQLVSGTPMQSGTLAYIPESVPRFPDSDLVQSRAITYQTLRALGRLMTGSKDA